MKKKLIFAEKLFTVIFLVLYSGALLTLILSNGANQDEEIQMNSSLILLVFSFNYLITFILLTLRWKKAIYVLNKDRHIPALVGLAVVSVLWSAIPGKTINRGIAIAGSSLFGLYLASRYSMKQQLKLLGWTFGIMTVLSFIFAIALPKYGIMGGIHQGKWRGIYLHKNYLGQQMVYGVIIFMLLAIGSKKKRYLFWIGLILSFILILLSGSTSALLNTIFVVSAFFPYQIFRWRDDLMIPGLITMTSIGTIFYIVLSALTEIILTSLGKDTTLTGRGDMWPHIFDMIWKKPLLGYGYGAFWSGSDTPSFYIWQVMGWKPPHSHNGFLDICLEVGFLGLSIFILGLLIKILPRALIWIRLSTTSEGFWPLLSITYMILTNLAESALFAYNNLFWVIYVAIAFSVQLPPECSQKKISKL